MTVTEFKIDADRRIPVQEISPQTIHGEGQNTGRLIDILRLSGCPVGCWFCDSGWSYQESKAPDSNFYSFPQLLEKLPSPTVLVTGGEPMSHHWLNSLCIYLGQNGKSICLETSGMYYQPLPRDVWVTVSPKDHVERSPKTVNMSTQPECWDRANEIKIVVPAIMNAGAFGRWYSKRVLIALERGIPVWVQPEWSDRRESLNNCMEIVKKWPHIRLSTQVHKFLSMP